MKTKIICSLKDGSELQGLLPDLPASNQQIGIKRMYDYKESVESYIRKKTTDNESMDATLGINEDEILIEMAKSMSNYEKKLMNTFELEIPDTIDIEELVNHLNSHDSVYYAEIDEVNIKQEVISQSVPNDPLFKDLYGLQNLECPSAWKKSEGSDIVVAVVDTGVDYNHPDIKDNLWVNEYGEYGYNFVSNNTDPMDDDGHGTHVAGTISATGNNELGIIGVAPKAKIMALKGLGPSGGYASNLAKCIRYAADHGAHIINNSWGPGKARSVKDAIEYADRKGSIVLFAAGNENAKVTSDMAAGNSRTISVAAVNHRDSRANFSNYGNLVDISAPGVSIVSLKFNSHKYVNKSGTSMACPHVAGLAALALSLDSGIKKKDLLAKFQEYSDNHFSSNSKPIGKGRINARKVVDSFHENDDKLAQIKSFQSIIEIGSNLFALRLHLNGHKNPVELKLASINDLEACINIIKKNSEVKYSFLDERLILTENLASN